MEVSREGRVDGGRQGRGGGLEESKVLVGSSATLHSATDDH